MPMVKVPNAGSAGVNKDLSAHELPINAWTAAENIRFLDGYAYQFFGHGSVYGTPSVTPYHVVACNNSGTRYWIYASLGKIYCVTNATGSAVHTDITRASGGDYTAAANSWTSTLLSGIPIMNPGNLADVPQQWGLNPVSPFAPLSNWPASTYCRSLRAYKNYLVALNVTKSGTTYPFMVKWSHPADPGAVPVTWDPTDATKDAGEFDLAEGGDQIVDGLQLRDSFMIYKEGSIWRMDYTGGVFVFRFSKVLGVSGAMNRNCIVEVDGFHVVLTTNDVVVHDGSQATSVLDKQARRDLFQSIDVNNSGNCFVFKNPFFNEVFICYPSIGSSACDKAIVWNYKDRTISLRDLPSIYHAGYGSVDNTLAGTWASDSDAWDSDLTLWDGPDIVPNASRVIMASSNTKLFMLDAAASFDGTLPTAYLERRGLSFGDPERMKLVKGIRPRIKGNNGQTVTIKVGYSDDPYAEPTYTTMTHTIGSTVANDCLVSGRYIAIRFENGTAATWRLDSYDLDIQEAGYW